MSRAELEAWLLKQAAACAESARGAIDAKEHEIETLESRVSLVAGTSDTDWKKELEDLRLAQTQLEQKIAEAERELETRSGELATVIDQRLASLRVSEDAWVLQQGQQLFDSQAPDDLSQPLHAISLPLLGSEMARSSLATDLQHHLEEEFEICSRLVREKEESQHRIRLASEGLASAEAGLLSAVGRLKEHSVDPKVIAATQSLTEGQWFLDEVVLPYHAASAVETGWELSRDILKDLS